MTTLHQARGWVKTLLIKLQIAFQLSSTLLPALPVYATQPTSLSKPAAPSNTEHQALQQRLAQSLLSIGNQSAANSAASFAQQEIKSRTTSALEKWLARFGTVRIDLNTNQRFTIDTGALDLLLPITDSKTLLSFSQLGIRKKDQQLTANLGFGQRYFNTNWMLGYNFFYDHNLTRHHQRAGFGLEAWRNFIKFSANHYSRLSGWKSSPDLLNYEERPANGFDLQLQAWLPALPSLGGKLLYEQYWGKEVALMGFTQRQHRPHALTVGVNYTPIPLLSLSLDHKRGTDVSDTKIGLALNYALGESFANQTNRSKVAQRRSVAGSRYDLVERNNIIVLEYRKQEQIQLILPKQIIGKSRQTIMLNYSVQAKQGVRQLNWQYPEITAAGGAVIPLGSNQLQIVLPAYQPTGNNLYALAGTATDNHGNTSSANTMVHVNPPEVSLEYSTISLNPQRLAADGKSTALVQINLRDENKQAITGMAHDLVLGLQETPTLSHNTSPTMFRAAPQKTRLGSLEEKEGGHYQATLTAGTIVSTVQVNSSFRGIPLPPAAY